MFSILLSEGGGSGDVQTMLFVAIAIFFLMVLLGWWVSNKGWLKQEEEPAAAHHDAHEEHTPEPAPAHQPQAEPAPVAAPESFSVEAAPVQDDDLTVLEGIGPKVAKLLAGMGISTFAALAQADPAKLREALDAAGYTYMEPAGWMEQAALAAAGDQEGLKKLQETLKGGRKAA
jgi:predicted flap endonuclease-1-like 5' DNA nuclease